MLSRLGEADLHKIVASHDRLYAFDAVLGAMLISDDGGKTFDGALHPARADDRLRRRPRRTRTHLIAATEEQLYRSEDGGETWRPLDPGSGVAARVAGAGRALRAPTRTARSHVSTDGGETWEPVGKVDGEPYKFKAVDDRSTSTSR